jgi:hypothetical protein
MSSVSRCIRQEACRHMCHPRKSLLVSKSLYGGHGEHVQKKSKDALSAFGLPLLKSAGEEQCLVYATPCKFCNTVCALIGDPAGSCGWSEIAALPRGIHSGNRQSPLEALPCCVHGSVTFAENRGLLRKCWDRTGACVGHNRSATNQRPHREAQHHEQCQHVIVI